MAGTRERLETFPRTPVVELIDRLPWIDAKSHFLWEQLVPEIRDPKIVAAIARLLARRAPPIERLRSHALWLRETTPGRAARRLAKRLLQPSASNARPPTQSRPAPRAYKF
jgi:hypothetical protein